MSRFTLCLTVAVTAIPVWAGEAEDPAEGSASSNQPAALDLLPDGAAPSSLAPDGPNVGKEIVTSIPPAEGQASAQTHPIAPSQAVAQPYPNAPPQESEETQGSAHSGGSAAGQPIAQAEPADEERLAGGATERGAPAGATRTSRSSVASESAGGWLRSRSVPWYRSGLMSLGVVLAVIAGVSLLLRRLVPSVRAMSGGAIEILGRNHLAPKQSLALVRVGRRIVLVGVTPERLSALCMIDDPHEVAELLGAATGQRALGSRSRFEAVLGEASGKFAESEAQAEELIPGPSPSLSQAKGQLQGLLARLKSLQADASSS